MDGIDGGDGSWVWDNNIDTSLFGELSTVVEVGDSPVPSPSDVLTLDNEQISQPLAEKECSPAPSPAGLLPQPSTSQGLSHGVKSRVVSIIPNNNQLLEWIKGCRDSDVEQLEKICTSEAALSYGLCDEAFTQQGNLTEHGESSISPVVSPSYEQEETDLSGTVCSEMDSHDNNAETGTSNTKGAAVSPHIEEKKKPYKCLMNGCGKMFANQRSLNKHCNIHRSDKSFICTNCGKGFAQKDYLAAHNRTHTGEKPFGCTACGKSFSQKGNLTKHERTHTGERPFGCTICGYKFAQNGDLVRHKRIHTGERPFPCKIGNCKYVAKDQSNLAAHKSRKHKE